VRLKSEVQGRENLLPPWWSYLRSSAPVTEFFDRHLAVSKNILRLFLGGLFIFALVFLAYLPILPGSFLMDDHRLVKDDNDLVNGTLTFHSLLFSGDFPLSTLGWWIEWHLFGENPLGYHIVNLLLHATSALLLWRLLEKLKIPGAWLAAAIFAVHPVCVNSVARIAELKNTLSLPFFILGFWAYLHYETGALYPARTDQAGAAAARHRATLWYALSLLAFILALFSKTTVIMFPVILLGCALWQRGRLTAKDALHLSPFFLLSLGFGLLSMWYQKHQALAGETLPPSGFAERLADAGWNFWFYLGKGLVPLNLSVIYLRWKPDLASITTYLPDLLVAVLFIVCWCFRRTWGRHALFGLGCFLVALFPALGFFDAQYLVKFQVSDHLQYLPLIAVVTLAAAALASLPNRKIVIAAGAVILLTLSGYTVQRTRVYATSEGLMRDTLEKNPAAWAAHNDLAVILAKRRDYAGAETHFQTSLRLNPENSGASLNLGQLLILETRYDEAREQLATAVQLHPDNPALREKYATALAQLGRPDAAAIQLKIALKLKPDAATRLSLAGILYGTGNYAEAAAQYREILAATPDANEPLNNLAWILATCPDDTVRNGGAAVGYAEHACLITRFKDTHPLGTLAAAYAEAGRFPEAVITADYAIRQATAAHDQQLVNMNQQLSSFYRAGQAWHEPRPQGHDQGQ
jgi:tetratricopeptide (TPR) repeat protein